MFKSFRLSAVLAGLTSLLGVVASPAVLGVLPPKWAAGVSVVGLVAQAFTKPVPRTDAPAAPAAQ